MFLTACDSAEPRTGDQNFEDAATSEQTSAAKSKDAGSKDDAGGKVSTGDGKKDADQAGGAKCGDKSCKDPAKCEDDSRCVCPDGYEDVNGDGSECKDVDECKDRSAKCGKGAGCKNTPGGYECTCGAPAYEKDGDECKCADGYKRDDQGYCVGDDGKQCADGADCEHGHCEGGICCAQSCAEPGECHVTDGAKCSDDGKSCNYKEAKDGAKCDDGKACTQDGTCKEGKCQESSEPTKCDDGNPCTDDSCEEPTGCRNQNNEATCDDGSACTSDDKCAGGTCKGSNERDCTANADVCNVGVCDPKSGECAKEPRKTSVVCDDADSCTTGDSCKDGTCKGGANACGDNATECKAGATGEVNMCSCKDGFVTFSGRCVPMNDECQKSQPCAADADCIDPSNTDGDLTCTCKPGFSGDGKTCVQTDPCATNPCGMGGTCTNGDKGTFSCVCAAGFRLVNGKCGCDLSGTFGVKATQTTSWKDIAQIEDGVVQATTYFIQKHTYGADGNLTFEITECGGTGYDLCDVPAPPLLGNEAYGQYVPDAIWATPSMPRTTVTVNLPDSQPGAAFKTDIFAMLSGIKLDNPTGEWPSDRTKVAGTSDSSGTAVNGATWLDPDNDGSLGLTTYAVGPGGEKADGTFPDPPTDYGADSPECPRASNSARYPYAYPPAVPSGSLSIQRIKRVFGATRAVFAYDGKIDSCDSVSGSVVGPSNGQARIDGRVIGCVRANGSGESACTAGAVDFLDKQPQTQKTSDAKFQFKRLQPNVTCKDVWAAKYD